jgi:hypothetical protein
MDWLIIPKISAHIQMQHWGEWARHQLVSLPSFFLLAARSQHHGTLLYAIRRWPSVLPPPPQARQPSPCRHLPRTHLPDTLSVPSPLLPQNTLSRER